MMCTECRHAGSLNEKGIYYMELGRVTDAQMVFKMSEEKHDRCQYASCSCQHRTGGGHRG